MTRRRPASSQRNDERLLDAAAAEIVAVGVDGLSMSAVARRAGLTTGALYARYESVGELAAAVWTSRVSEAHHELLDIAVRSMIDKDRTVDLDRLHDELRSPSDTMLLAIELLATARRIDELEEVVLPDVQSWLARWHAGARSRNPRRRAQVVLTLATVWGIVLHEIPHPCPSDWTELTRRLRRSFNREYTAPARPLVANRVVAVHADTGSPGHDALLDSVAVIVARVGFERATATRISRRAGLTAGSIYARYRTKDELLQHAVKTLLPVRLSDALAVNSSVFNLEDPGMEMARIVGGLLSAPRREWRRFRIETQLAARHRPALARALDDIQESAIRNLLAAIGAKTEEERRVLDLPARFALLNPLGLGFVELVAPGIPSIDWRLVFVPLLSSP